MVLARSQRLRAASRDVELRARKIRVVAVDVDGVLTDGRIAIDARGREARTFHAADRRGVGLLRRAGIHVVGLAAGPVPTRPAYVRKLGLTTVVPGEGRGLTSIQRFCRQRRLALDAVAYVGRDVLDLPLLAAVGLGITVADGADHAKRDSSFVTVQAGGGGALREVAERILRAQGKWASTIGETWRDWE